MSGIFNLTPKRLKKLQKIFTWFAIFSLVLQMGSGAFLARPAFAEETTPPETPVEQIVESAPTEEPADEAPAEEPVEEVQPELVEGPVLTVEQEEEMIEEPAVDEEIPEEAAVEEEPIEEPEPDLEEPEVAEESAELNPSVFTDKEDYAPGETAKIIGENFPINTILIIRVTRPDGSVVKGDGSFEEGNDEVETDEEGWFEYHYQLNGIEGEYLVEVLLGATVLATTTFTDNTGGYNVQLTSPTPPTSSTSFTWIVSGSSPGSGQEISHVDIYGCWSANDVVEATASAGSVDYNGTGHASHVSKTDGLVTVESIDDGDLSLLVTITFNQSFPSASDGSATAFVKTGGGPDEGFEFLIGGPNCAVPEPFCGDGDVDPGEECDDGNNENGDGCSADCETECVEGEAWASGVVNFNQGTRKDGSPVLAERSNPNNALGAPDSPQPVVKFVSLGVNGSIVLSFTGWVLDVDGNDLSFHETTWGRAGYPVEKAEVQVSQDGSDWRGSWEVTNKDGSDGVGYVDFSPTGLPWIKYVKIADTTNYGPLSGDADGYDLDAVDAINQVCEEPRPVCDPNVELVTNGGFESPVVGTSQKWDIYDSGTAGLGWNVEWYGGSTSYGGQTRPDPAHLELHRGVNGWLPYSGSQHSELDTDWDGPGGGLNNEPASASIYQDISTIPGEWYTVKFYFSPRPDTDEANNQLQLKWGGTVIDTISAPGDGNTQWAEHTYNFQATNSTTQLEFTDVGTPDSLGTFLDDVSLRCGIFQPEPECGNGVKEGNEECDGEDGVGENEFCTPTCQLTLIYDGAHACPPGTVRSGNPIATYSIFGTDPDGETFLVSPGQGYLFEASGTFIPTSASGYQSDAGYTTLNGVLVPQYGIHGTPPDLGAHALLANLGDGVGIVDWGDYNPDHVYAKYYEPSVSSLQFLIGDRYDNWFGTPWDNQSGMSDNSGSLNLNVYECIPCKDITGRKINADTQDGIEDWPIYLLEKIDAVTVLPDGNNYSSSVSLNNGENYYIEVLGTYIYITPGSGGSSGLADAEYSDRPDWSYGPGWKKGEDVFPPAWTNALDLLINGSNIDWGSYNPVHRYSTSFTGGGSPVNFSIWDSSYGDNSDSLTVNIYRIIDETLTDEDGYYEFEDICEVVEDGVYVAEGSRPGWVQVLPEGGIYQVDEQETYDFVNDPLEKRITGVKFNDLNGDGRRGDEPGLEGWTIKAVEAAEPIEVVVDSTEPDGTTIGLPSGDYLLVAIGDWRGAQGEQNRVDAEYLTNDWWVTHTDGNSGQPWRGPDQGDLIINGNFVDWGPYHPGHVYLQNFHQESEGPVNFSVFDGNAVTHVKEPGWYADNSGTITVYILKVIAEDVTDEDGSYELIIPCDYSYVLVFEIPQRGWQQTGPIGPSPEESGYYYLLELEPGQTIDGIDFGNREIPRCGNGRVEGEEECDDGNNLDGDGCSANCQIEPVIIKAYKVICESEEELPNWGNHGSTIDQNTAQNWVSTHPGCVIAEDWKFQYGPAGSGSFGSFQTETDEKGVPWQTFNVNSDAIISDLSEMGGRIETREVFPDDQYIGFSNDDSNNVSAEFYCTGDVYHYDNWEWINNPQYGQTYYCVAFNAPQYGSISGKKWEDLDGDAYWDGGEPALDGWIIFLDENDNQVLDAGEVSTITSEGGIYSFTDLVPGDYDVCEVIEPGWTRTLPGPGLDCYYLTIQPGDELIDYDFGNFELGKIQGRKYNDLNGNGSRNSGEPYLNNWTIRLYRQGEGWEYVEEKQTGHTGTTGQYRFENLTKGTYKICEVLQSGWTETAPSGAVNNQQSDEAPRCRVTTINTSGQVKSGRSFGNFKHVKLSGYKVEDEDGDGDPTESMGEPRLDGWTINLEKQGEGIVDSAVTGDGAWLDGYYEFIITSPGTYTLTEVPQAGWVETYPAGIVNYTYPASSGLTIGGINFLNYEKGRITACKWDDYDGDQGKDEPIEGVTMSLYGEGGECEGECPINGGPIDSCETDETGCCTFDGLYLGDYTVEEDTEDPDLAGYEPTSPTSVPVILNTSGQEETVDFFNELQPIELSLEKSNDKEGVTSGPGVTVTYTLVVTNDSEITAYDATLTDVLPYGFSYVANSGSVDGTPTNPSISGSTLTWSLGDIPSEGSVIIIYQALTASDLEEGTYTNMSVAVGYNRPSGADDRERSESNVDDSVVRLAVTHGFSASIGGTVLGISTEKVGEVLGAATGAPTIFIIIAILMIVMGFAFYHWEKIRRFGLRKVLRGIILSLVLLVFATGVVQAVVKVSITDLPDYLNTTDFKVYYTALDTNPSPSYNVAGWLKKEGGSWKQFDVTKHEPSGFFQAKGENFDGEAKYDFKIVANGVESLIETVTLDFTSPEAPRDYRKERISLTAFKLYWRNPNNSDFAKVLVYRSEKRDFTADDSTKIGDRGGSPDQEMDYVDGVLPVDKEYFYAIRALDKAGNASGLAGDGGSVTYEETIVEITPTPGEVVILPAGEVKEEEGQILGGAVEEEVSPTEAGGIAGAVARITGEGGRGWLYGLGGLIILGIFGYLLYRRRS